jgi:hypothetical protein
MFAESPAEYEDEDPDTVVCVRSSHRVDEFTLLPALEEIEGSQLPQVWSLVALAFSIAPRACTIDGSVSIARSIASSREMDWL